MKLRKVLLLFFVCFSFTEVFSTHLVGGFASYEYMGRVGNTNNFRYRIYFTVYRDCKSAVDFDESMSVCIYDGNNNLLRTELIYRGRTRKVDPVGNTNCPHSTQACIEVNVYEKIITLPQSNFGYTMKWERCCRNTQVNLPNAMEGGIMQPSQGQTYLATIPSTAIVNSSPYFTEVPVPFICLNDTTQIRSYAVDPDGDSLVFRFVRPWAGGGLNAAIPACESRFYGPKNITYNSGYNENQPFGSDGHASINPATGTMTLVARELGNFALAVDVEEYRNGILLSKVRLDIQLLVINCPPNRTPRLSAASRTFTREVMAGSQLCFNITALDDDDHRVKLSGYGEIFTGGGAWTGPTATFPIREGHKQATSQFCWTPSCEQARGTPYTFTVEAIDDGCPSKFLNETYYIYVRPFKSNLTLTGATPVCEGLLRARYRAGNTITGSTVRWEVEGGQIISGQGTNEIFVNWDYSQPGGKVIATEVSAGGCEDVSKTFNVTFLPRPEAPTILSPDSVCVGTSVVFTSLQEGLDYYWIMPSGTLVNNRTVGYNATQTGEYTVKHYVINEYDCPSDTASKTFKVVEPLAMEIIGPKTVCPNNGNIMFYVEGYPGSTYRWIADGAVIQKGQGTDTITLAFGDPTVITLKVVETTPLGCVGDTLYHDIAVTYDLLIESPLGEQSVCEFTEREKYIPNPFVHNTIYYWTVTGGDIDEIDPAYNLYVNWGAAGTGKISYYQTAYDTLNSKQCLSNTAVIDIIKNPIPDADFIEGIFEVCQYTDSLVFTLNGFAASTYYWEINGLTNLSGQGTRTIKFPTGTAGTFTISVQEVSEFDCIGERIDSVFIIHPKPVTTPIVGDSILCHPDFSNRTYTVTGFPTSTFHWTVSGGVRQDSSFLPFTTINWHGEQNNLISLYERSAFGCIGDTLSLPVFIDSPAIDIRVVTVSPPPASDKQLIVNWELLNAPRYDTTFAVYKRSVNPDHGFQKIGEVSKNEFTFTESNVNTKLTPFDFQIRGYDLCRNDLLSPIHRTVLLTGDKPEEYTVEMNFTPYLGWHEGVMDYVVYRQLANKTPFEEYDREITPVRIYYENGTDHYTQCYRVKATESNGRQEESWSNEVCFNFPPLMFIPNAFSPDGNGLNDGFGVTAAAIKDFKMTVFNRWGEQLFVTNDFKSTWDGTFMGTPSPQGVYMYRVEYTDFSNRLYETKGTFHLMR